MLFEDTDGLLKRTMQLQNYRTNRHTRSITSAFTHDDALGCSCRSSRSEQVTLRTTTSLLQVVHGRRCYGDCTEFLHVRTASRQTLKYLNRLKLFLAISSLQSVVIDILGPLSRTRLHKRFIVVITDRFSKSTHTEVLG